MTSYARSVVKETNSSSDKFQNLKIDTTENSNGRNYDIFGVNIWS